MCIYEGSSNVSKVQTFLIAFAEYMQESCPDLNEHTDLLELSNLFATRVHLDKEILSTLSEEETLKPWTKLKCINAVYETVNNVTKYMNLAPQSQGRYEHPDSAAIVSAMFSPEASVDDINDDVKEGFAKNSWQSFLASLAQVKSDHKTHAYAHDKKILLEKVEQLTNITRATCPEPEVHNHQMTWKDSLTDDMKASEFFNVEQVKNFMSVDKFNFAGCIKAVDQDVNMCFYNFICMRWSGP